MFFKKKSEYFFSLLSPLIFFLLIFFVGPQVEYRFGQVLHSGQESSIVGISILLALIIEPIALAYLLSRVRLERTALSILSLSAHAIIVVILFVLFLRSFGIETDPFPWWAALVLILLILKEVYIAVEWGSKKEKQIRESSSAGVAIAYSVIGFFSFVSYVLFWGAVQSNVVFADYVLVLFFAQVIAFILLSIGMYLGANMPSFLLREKQKEQSWISYVHIAIAVFVSLFPAIFLLTDLSVVRSVDQLSQIEQAEKIYLSNTQLRTIPEELFLQKHVRILRLTHNAISVLPSKISTLSDLEELYIGENKLIGLPKEIDKLQSLRVLHVYSNDLAALPETLSNISSLEELNVSFNAILYLPPSFGSFVQLKTLDLRANQVSEIPEELGTVSSLQYLDLGDNKIQKLPENLDGWKTLKKLELDGNPLLPSEKDRLMRVLPEVDIIF